VCLGCWFLGGGRGGLLWWSDCAWETATQRRRWESEVTQRFNDIPANAKTNCSHFRQEEEGERIDKEEEEEEEEDL
jgi:hypothetical protein